jgi:cation:H+ antiporter
MEVKIPRAGVLAMPASLVPFGWVLFNDGIVSRSEGILLLIVCTALVVWLYRASPVLLATRSDGETKQPVEKLPSRRRALLMLAVGTAGLLVGAELVVAGASGIIEGFGVSETFFGMTVVAIGESLEETARMVSPARRGRSDVALGNVVGTTIILLTLNLGLIALVRPIIIDPWVLKFHVPFLILCVLFAAALLVMAKRLGRWVGGVFILLYLAYVVINLQHA